MQSHKWVLGGFAVVTFFVVAIFWMNKENFSQKRVAPGETIKIVTSFPMRGITVGQGISNGIKLALEEAQYRSGSFSLVLVTEDDGDENGKWQASLEEGIAKRAVADTDVMAYIGTYNSGAAKISIPITNKASLAQVSPGNTWPGLTQPGFTPGEPGIFYPTGVRNYFRVVPTDALQGPAGAVWAKSLGVQSVYIFDDGEAYGKGIATLFKKKAVEIGLQVVGHTTLLDKSVKGIEKELHTLKSTNVDLVYYGGITPNGAVPLVKGLREKGISAKFMVPDGTMEQAFLDQAGDAAQGTLLTVVGVPIENLSSEGQLFAEKYRKRFGIEPETFSVFGYETAKATLLAIEKSGKKDRASILQAMSEIKDYEGLFGKWSFDQNGDTTLSLVSGNVVRDGKFVFEKLLHQ
ncbi:MAG: branched-chain amino acid ABC transporter substrate-binding protein [Candidatus Moranbacteria bacterium]|nr:branched-chain amino acid ABC transporter substrate-binding protein [Candidatus Moranbacteria bacterium]